MRGGGQEVKRMTCSGSMVQDAAVLARFRVSAADANDVA